MVGIGGEREASTVGGVGVQGIDVVDGHIDQVAAAINDLLIGGHDGVDAGVEVKGDVSVAVTRHAIAVGGDTVQLIEDISVAIFLVLIDFLGIRLGGGEVRGDGGGGALALAGQHQLIAAGLGIDLPLPGLIVLLEGDLGLGLYREVIEVQNITSVRFDRIDLEGAGLTVNGVTCRCDKRIHAVLSLGAGLILAAHDSGGMIGFGSAVFALGDRTVRVHGVGAVIVVDGDGNSIALIVDLDHVFTYVSRDGSGGGVGFVEVIVAAVILVCNLSGDLAVLVQDGNCFVEVGLGAVFGLVKIVSAGVISVLQIVFDRVSVFGDVALHGGNVEVVGIHAGVGVQVAVGIQQINGVSQGGDVVGGIPVLLLEANGGSVQRDAVGQGVGVGGGGLVVGGGLLLPEVPGQSLLSLVIGDVRVGGGFSADGMH